MDERREINRKMESRMAVLETKVDNLDKKQCEADKRNTDDHSELKDGISKITAKLDAAIDNKADKAEFLYWRNILVGTVGISILLMLLSLVLSDAFKK